jgi:putative hydrolase of the HAD superfamily
LTVPVTVPVAGSWPHAAAGEKMEGAVCDTRFVGLALFDLDNTLLDRESAFVRWAEAFILEHGLPEEAWPFMESADQDGMTPKEIFFEQVRAEFGISRHVEELLARYYVDYPACYTAEAETVRGLRQLRGRGWRVGVVTNGGPVQLAKLEATNLTGEFDAICVSDIVGAKKPDPAIFEMVADLCERPLEGWMTGDSVSADMAGGRGVGLRTIWIARGREWASSDPAPDAVVLTVPQAIKIILESDLR